MNRTRSLPRRHYVSGPVWWRSGRTCSADTSTTKWNCFGCRNLQAVPRSPSQSQTRTSTVQCRYPLPWSCYQAGPTPRGCTPEARVSYSSSMPVDAPWPRSHKVFLNELCVPQWPPQCPHLSSRSWFA